jgi:GGDEF domain-containing protein
MSQGAKGQTLQDQVLRRARAAIGTTSIQLASPFAVAEARVRRAHGFSAPTPEEVFAFWESRQPGSRVGDDRYRWEVSHKRCQPGAHVPPEGEWRPFRPDLPKDRELGLSLPLSITEQASFLAETAERSDATGVRARTLLSECEPLMRRDLAACIAAASPWCDTFALLSLTKHDRALDRFGPIALAIATSYASLSDKGAVTGLRSPFYEKPLVSASAQLATALVKLGVELARVGALVRHVREAQHDSGGWGDPHGQEEKFGRDELLTTLVSADLLARVDPKFDPERALQWMAAAQSPSGFFMAFGPELVWLTGEVVDFQRDTVRSFSQRFGFPHVPALNLDRKTGLPFFAYFDDLARLFGELPGVAETTTELAFIDLAGFRAFNTTYGQDLGDSVLSVFAETITGVKGARAIRDGGDEFLVLGSPTRRGLAKDLDDLRTRWPAEFRANFPNAGVVSPRILVAATKCGDIRACREALGRRIGELKAKVAAPPPEGVLEVVEECLAIGV